MVKFLPVAICAVFVSGAFAEEVLIVGNVQSKCQIIMDTEGVYGNSTPDTLSTDAADGGVEPIIRYDVLQANYYKAVIAHPMSFSESPTLIDNTAWTGSTEVSQTSDADMSAYEDLKVTYDNKTEYDLTVAGSTWFSVSSDVAYGFDRAFPSGTYRSVVQADCIAK